MRSDLTWRLRRATDEIEKRTSDSRYVDFGLRIWVVRQNEESGTVVYPGRPKVDFLYSEDFGGVFDTRLLRWHDESANPVVWYASEEQFELITHRVAEDKVLVFGAEGSGKTSGVLSKWIVHRIITDFAGEHVQLGATAPIWRRLQRLREAMFADCPPEWRVWREAEGIMRFGLGPSVRFVSAHSSRAAEGSPLQSFDFVACAADELQDMYELDGDIEARGRRAPAGRYRRMNTATARYEPGWISFREQWAENPLCTVRRLEGLTNPFVATQHWENLRLTLSPREYQRRVLAMDVSSERATYPTYSDKESLRRVPDLGADDVTARVLSPWGRNLSVLVGHDPGSVQDYSVILKAYQEHGKKDPDWYAVDEVRTKGTTGDHVHRLAARLRERWHCNGLDYKGRPIEGAPQAFVRADPYSTSGSDEAHPDKSLYTHFRNAGLKILPAALHADPHSVKAKPIPKEAGIDMVCSLLQSASGRRRLYLAMDDSGKCQVPLLRQALMLSERDDLGRAEKPTSKSRKGPSGDLSDMPAALRYALWAVERPKLVDALGAER